jgi:hypothetical protein
MISNLTDLGRWAATDLGTDLLPAELARERLDTHDIGGDSYGLGIKRFGAWYGHDGDAFGWDSLAVHNPAWPSATAAGHRRSRFSAPLVRTR